MRTVSFLLSIIVGILSIVLFREHILETASVLYNNSLNFFNNSTNPVGLENDVAPQSFPVPAEQSSAETTTTTNMSVPRAIRKAFLAVEQAEGAGARVRRSIGTPQLRNFSPFLMLDHFSVKPGAGFPDHPHRGQEVSTVHTAHTFLYLPHSSFHPPLLL